jgi:hypothetical protein
LHSFSLSNEILRSSAAPTHNSRVSSSCEQMFWFSSSSYCNLVFSTAEEMALKVFCGGVFLQMGFLTS